MLNSIAIGGDVLSQTVKMEGKLICFCGIDGSGKSTHIEEINKQLKFDGYKTKMSTLVTRNGLLFKTINPILNDMNNQTYCDLIAFERYKAIKRRLLYEMKSFDIVLNNRFLYTDLAYTRGYAQNTDFIEALIELSPKPDLVLLFDVDSKIAMDRIKRRDKPIFDKQENITQLTRTRNAYIGMAQEFKFQIIDTSEPFLETTKKCKALIEKII